MQSNVGVIFSVVIRNKITTCSKYLISLEKYGEKVRTHFNDYKKANNGVSRKRNFSHTRTCDDNIIAFIKKTNTTDKLSKVLIEGMDKVKEQDERGAMLINTKSKENEKKQSKKSTKNEKGGISNRAEIQEEDTVSKKDDSITTSPSEKSESSSEVIRRAWDELSLIPEFPECIPATDYEKRVTFNTLGKAEIELAEVDKWKNRNWNILPVLVQKSEGLEYKALKKIVRKIEIEKEKEKLRDNKYSILGEDDDEDEESDTESEGTDHPKHSESLPQNEKSGKGQGV